MGIGSSFEDVQSGGAVPSMQSGGVYVNALSVASSAGAAASSEQRACEVVQVVLEDGTPDRQREEEEKEETTGEHNLEWPGTTGCLC